jgi:hypothetical protein
MHRKITGLDRCTKVGPERPTNMRTLHSIIEGKQSLILETLVSEVRVYHLAPGQRTNAELAACLGDYLNAVAVALRRGHRKDPEALQLAAAHGDQRAQIGYDVIALVGEFGILRSTVVEVAQQNDALNVAEMERFCEILHASLLAALARFVVTSDAPAKARATAPISLATTP